VFGAISLDPKAMARIRRLKTMLAQATRIA
jgi:hypothetical protein